MQEIRLRSVDELIRALNDLTNNYIFRGHADADWILQSSLERVIGANWNAGTAIRFEEFALNQFRSKFHLYDRENMQPRTKLAWLAVMQHYGVPTRLLDFTESPYVALYFALEAYSATRQPDFAVYAIDYTGVMDRSLAEISRKDTGFKETRQSVQQRQDEVFEETVDRFSYKIAWSAEPKEMNARLDRQAGSFLICGDRAMRIQEVLDSSVYVGVNMLKFRIEGKLYQHVFALLRKMNITSKSLYGDLEGLARSIKMQMQVYSVP